MVKLTERMIARYRGRKTTVCVGRRVGKRLDEGTAVFLGVLALLGAGQPGTGRWVLWVGELGAGSWELGARLLGAWVEAREGPKGYLG